MSQDSIVVEPSPEKQTPGAAAQQPVPDKSAAQPEPYRIPNDDNSVDPTYRGKSVSEIIEMHKQASSKIGQQGQEIGAWRGLVSELSQVTRQVPKVEPKAAPKITSDALLTNPTEAISSVIRHELAEALAPLRAERVTDKREEELAALNSDFPDYIQTGNDPGFQQWATGARGRAADARAAAGGDIAASRRLLEAWEDRKSLTKQAPIDTGKPQGVQGAKSVVTESGGGGQAAPTGKIFNRAEVVQLIIDKPEVYASDAYQAELLQAAKEGRIR